MNSYDWLLVRATKDQSPTIKRLRRIYAARCHVSSDTDRFDQYLAKYLIALLNTTKHKADLSEVLVTTDPEQCWKIGSKPEDPHWVRILLALASQIRQTDVSAWDGYRIPARFRNATVEV